MRRLCTNILLHLLLLPVLAWAQAGDVVRWEALPPLPDAIGVAGAYAGTSGDALIVAGGANFPGGSNWEGHPKVWQDAIYVLPSPASTWQTGYRLPRPLAYGVSASWGDALLALGGGDGQQHYTQAYRITWNGSTIALDTLPPLPIPMAYGAGVLLNDTLYLVGGIETPTATTALHTFWALDLSVSSDLRRWEVLPPWPGPARILPVMAVHNDQVFLFSGARLYADANGAPAREVLTDAYRYNPVTAQWTRLTDTPRPMVAVPGPALPLGASHLLFLSGDDGRYLGHNATLKDDHPGFPTELFAYHPLTDRWSVRGHFPKDVPDDRGPHRNLGTYPPVTTPVVAWQGRYVLPSGEIRPGVRTPQVMAATWVPAAQTFGGLNALVLGGYLVLLVGLGVYFARRSQSTEDFFLAGGRIPWWAAGLSIFATMLSAITYLSIPATAFATDWTRFLLNMGIPLVAPVVILFFLPFYRRLHLTSAYAYLERRFDVSVRMLGSLSFVLFQLGRMGVVVLLPALALSAVTGLDLTACILLMGLLSTLYTVLGGMEAVIWTDALQVLILLGGAMAALVIIIADVPGGAGQILTEAAARGKLNLINPGVDLTRDSLLVIVVGMVFANLLPYTTDQAVVQRYLTTPTEATARRAIWTGALLAVPASVLFFFLGTALFVFYLHVPDHLTPLAQPDQLFPWFIASEMPPGLAGLVIAGIFAAAMSSLDSSMHAVATALTTDFARRFRPGRPDRDWLRLARRLTVLLGILGTASALMMAYLDLGTLWGAFLTLIGLFLGTLGGLFTLGIFTRRTTARHAWIGAAASAAALAWCTYATPLSGLLFGAIGTLVCVAVALLASYVLPMPAPDTTGLTVYTLQAPRQSP